jgi:CHAT domain-containing protein
MHNQAFSFGAFALSLWFMALPASAATASLRDRHLSLREDQTTPRVSEQPSAIALELESESLESLHQEAALYHEKGYRRLEAYTLSRIAKKIAAQGDPVVAIVFYKRSLNLVESVRSELRHIESLSQRLGLETPQLQATLVDTFAQDIYRPLADLLLQQGRTWEAQQVLDLMIIQELDEYFQDVQTPPRDRQGQTAGPGGSETLDSWDSEQTILQDYGELQRQAVQKGQALDQLRAIPANQRTAAQNDRIAELVNFQQALSRQFNDFTQSEAVVAQVNQVTRVSRQQNLNLEDLNSLRDNLRQLENQENPERAALLYPLILKDRLELILTTPESPPLRYTVPVTQQQLETVIGQFRRYVSQPGQDPRPLAQKLYQWLIKPLEADLRAAGTDTLIYAPDGQLRYVPLAALYDGRQWLVERYRINYITARSLTDLNTHPHSQPSLLAAAFVKGSYKFNVGSNSLVFQGLPFAGVEVQALASIVPNTSLFEDQAFNPRTLVPKMDDYNIVHLATHATLISGDPESSFIVFGSGDRVTLRDIETWSLPNVDLVVLSACETALGGVLGNGTEILGLGYQMQRSGARATIASLWQVDDGGTQQLMEAFYHSLENFSESKAEALRQAQLALIQGTENLNHPYYWAPFILIGNGL